jgi:hypothetical protein
MSKDHDPQSHNRVVPRLEALEDRLLLSELPFLSEFPFLTAMRTSGAAVQVGSTLEIAVASPVIPGFGLSSTLIVEDGRGNVAVEWNGLPPHFYSGIDTVTLNGVAPGNLALFVSLAPRTSPQQVAVQMTGMFNAFVGLVTPLGASFQLHTAPTFHGLSLVL